MYKVFLVDDEPFIIEGLHYIIDWREFGLEIAGFANDGKTALNTMRELRAEVLITDISMPVMNGLELIRELRSFMPELKIIVLSGFNEFDYLKQGMKYGIENYLLKPINVQELKETLRVTSDKLNAPYALRWSDNDIGILRENILSRWAAGRISPLELKERASLLQIDISAPFFMAAVIRCPDREAACQEAVAAALEGVSATVFRDFEGDTVLLFALAGCEPSIGRERALTELAMLRLRLPQFRLRLTVGCSQAAASGAAVSYAQARAAQEYFLIWPEDETIDCGHLEPAGGEDRFSFVFPWPLYVKLIRSRDAAGLEQRIAADVEQLRSEPGVTPFLLRSAVDGLLRSFRSELKSEAQSEQQHLHLDEIEQIRRTTDIGELISIVQEAGRRLLDGLDRETKSPVIAGLLERIHSCYGEPLSLRQLGQEFNAHPVYLGQLFQKEAGTAFTDYLNRYRIGKAKELLRESRHKVHEIAQLVGYVETGYFYKQFKKYVGISPMDYKEMVTAQVPDHPGGT